MAMNQISVAVNGALGKVGREVISAVPRDSALSLIGAIDIKASRPDIELPDNAGSIPLFSDFNSLLQICRPQVLVDFTIAEAAMASARIACRHGVNLVIGTTGLSENDLKEIDSLCKENKVGAVVAFNFALGAVVLMHLAGIASRYFDQAEIIEMHHNQKADAPSGTALATAKAMLKSRGRPFTYSNTARENIKGTRGGEVEGIAIHSVRLPGFVAHEEVIFGGQGQTLTLRHDTTSRDSFIPGVIISIKEVVKLQGLVFGLDKVLNLKGE
jgi:4-hydroxy-tetrahydrodipicolinate reductase